MNAQSKGKSHDVPESRHCGKRRLLQTRDQNFVTSTQFLAENEQTALYASEPQQNGTLLKWRLLHVTPRKGLHQESCNQKFVVSSMLCIVL